MTLSSFSRDPVAATEDERPALIQLQRLLGSSGDGQQACPLRLIGAAGEEVEVPDTVRRLLDELVYYLARGDAIALVQVGKSLTTQRAADLLNVSRPHLIQLLERRQIPFTMTGAHRRVRFDDLMAYKRDRDAKREDALTRLTQMSEELGLYDGEERVAESALQDP